MDWTLTAHVSGIIWTLDLLILLTHITRHRKRTGAWPGRFVWYLVAVSAIGIGVNLSRVIWGMTLFSAQVSAIGGLVVAFLLLGMIVVTVVQNTPEEK